MRRLTPVVIAISLCLLVAAAFANATHGALIFDGKGLIVDDPRVHSATAANIDLIFQHSYWWHKGPSGLYRPLTTLSYLLNYAVLGSGESPEGYHILNILLHAINVLLAFVITLKLSRRMWLSGAAAAVWAVHPLVTESVTNTAGRPDLLAALSVLAAFLCYLRAAEASGVRRVLWLAGLFLASLAGAFSKETAAVIAGVLISYELLFWRNRRVALLLGCAAALVPLQIMLYQRSVALSSESPAQFPFTDNPIVAAPFWQGKLTALSVLGRGVALTLWPAKLSADYSYNQIPLFNGSAACWAMLVLALGAAAAFCVLGRRHRLVAFAGVFAFLLLLPSANLLFPIGTVMAERFLYLPSLALITAIVAAAAWALRRPGRTRLAGVLMALVVCALAGRTWARNEDWRDDQALAQATATAAPNSYKSRQMLAEALFLRDSDHQRIDPVIRETEAGLAILAGVPDERSSVELYRLGGDSYIIKGEQLRAAGDAAGGAAADRRAVELLQRGSKILELAVERQTRDLAARGVSRVVHEAGPNDHVYRLLAEASLALKDDDKAFQSAIEYRKRAPLDPATYSLLARVLVASGQPEDAATALMEGMLVTSDMGLRKNLIDFYRSSPAVSACAITAGPNGPAINPACPLVHRNLCEGTADAIRIRLQSGRRDVAKELHRAAIADYRCPAGPLDEALAFGGDRP